jgi:hypothetical protein
MRGGSTQPDTTSELQLEDEEVATNRATTVIPLGQGEIATTIRWASPIWGSSQGPNPYGSGGKKQ